MLHRVVFRYDDCCNISSLRLLHPHHSWQSSGVAPQAAGTICPLEMPASMANHARPACKSSLTAQACKLLITVIQPHSPGRQQVAAIQQVLHLHISMTAANLSHTTAPKNVLQSWQASAAAQVTAKMTCRAIKAVVALIQNKWSLLLEACARSTMNGVVCWNLMQSMERNAAGRAASTVRGRGRASGDPSVGRHALVLTQHMKPDAAVQRKRS